MPHAAEQVAERGLAFVRTFSELLAAQQADGQLPPLFREAWAHSACVSLAKTTCAQFAVAKHVAPPAEEQPPAADRQERPVGYVNLKPQTGPAGTTMALTDDWRERCILAALVQHCHLDICTQNLCSARMAGAHTSNNHATPALAGARSRSARCVTTNPRPRQPIR